MITCTGNIWCQMLLNMSRESLMITCTGNIWCQMLLNMSRESLMIHVLEISGAKCC